MNLKKLIVLMLAAGSLAAVLGFSLSDDGPIQQITRQLKNWLSGHPQEKVYLQTDKSYYAVGDNIWFKSYVVVGSEHRLSAVSGVLNVDLIDEDNVVVNSLKLPVNKGLAWGDFELADSLKEGNYRVRAYTNWMRNAGEDYFFNKNIVIVNSITNNVFTKTGYTYTEQNGSPLVSADITYSNLNGEPITGKPVSYKVMLGTKSIGEGKGITNNNGSLRFSFAAKPKETFTGRRIITKLSVGGQIVTKKIIIKALSDKAMVQFFPEGGTLVNGTYSKMAFKAVGADGLGVDVRGIVVDDLGKQAATFSNTHLGMGEFSFTPLTGRTYQAKFTYGDGSENSASLVAATDAGYAMRIDNSNPGYINVKIIAGSKVNSNTNAGAGLSLVAQAEGVICYAGKSTPGSTSLNAAIPKSKFPTGIVQFTLFSPTGEPMNERLVFIENPNELKLDINTSKQTYSPREKVSIDLKANDKNGKPVTASFSVAVTDEKKTPVDESSESTILSNLLLTSDLKGYIEKPNYYFTTPTEKTRADLDVLMLTQGFRRFEWKQVLDNTYKAAVYQPEKSLQISGRLLTPGGKPVAHGKISLLNTNGNFFMADTTADEMGKFTFNDLIFKDGLKFTMQGRTAKGGKNVQVEMDTITTSLPGINKNAPDMQVNVNEGLTSFLKSSKVHYDDQVKYGLINGSIKLKEVIIRDKKTLPEMLRNSGNLNGPGNADKVLLATDIYKSAYMNIESLIRSDIRTKFMLKKGKIIPAALFVLDGAETPYDIVYSLNVNEIESVEFLSSIRYSAIYGSRGMAGVIVITTKRGDSPPSYPHGSPGLIVYNPKGYSKVREFYSPRYDDPNINTGIPDRRSTIYWKPNIITGNDGKAGIEYFNADNKGTYRIVVEGIDSEGNLGRRVYRYRVE